MIQATLFDRPAASGTLSRRQKRIVKILIAAGEMGLTRNAIARKMRSPDHGISSAVRALLDAGHIVASNRKRKTEWGRLATVLIHRKHGERE